MNGRLLGIKKTFLLRACALLFLWGFLAYIFVCIFVLKNPVLWFFGFCLFLGVFEIIKSTLFCLDSSLYLGSLITSIGIVGFIFSYTPTAMYAAYYIAGAFIIASLVTYTFCGQRFHLIIAFIIQFLTIYSLLLTKNFISVPIFIAFIVPFLILLIVEILLNIKRRR